MATRGAGIAQTGSRPTADNAAAGGGMIPLLSLGLPFTPSTAVLLSGMLLMNVTPGPFLLRDHPSVFWGVIGSFYVGNVMLLLLNLPLVGMWVKLLSIPAPMLYGGILVFATLGVYSYNQSVFDLGLLLVFGVVGYVMRRFDFPVAPAIIGMILGPLAEENFRRALSITQGDYSVFVTHPISAALLAIALLIVVAPALMRLLQRRRLATS
jgi:putative tricarboxylic transport membrane protein